MTGNEGATAAFAESRAVDQLELERGPDCEDQIVEPDVLESITALFEQAGAVGLHEMPRASREREAYESARRKSEALAATHRAAAAEAQCGQEMSDFVAQQRPDRPAVDLMAQQIALALDRADARVRGFRRQCRH